VEEKEEKLPINSLFRNPEIAREIGFLIMYSANLEIWLLEAFKLFVKREEDVVNIIFGHMDNISTKIDIFYRCLDLKKGWLMAQNIAKTENEVRAAISFRNLVAHGQHGLSQKGLPNVTANFLTLKRGKPKTITLTVDKIHVHVEALRSTIAIMRRHVGADLMLHHPGTIDGISSEPPLQPSQTIPRTIRPRKARQVPKRHNQPETPPGKE